MKTLGRDAAYILIGCIIGLAIQDSFSKPISDEQKWAAFERNREIRRATEAKFEACTSQCMKGCVK